MASDHRSPKVNYKKNQQKEIWESPNIWKLNNILLTILD